ncbi:MAG: hypothetical protein FRX48_04069 [Lasallia pustulata]|uniref:Potassium channel tetramerisation-type BTB domain-containing protein n=1 Tax=Lasallia pustulata TaxID=136370 RepID=A0A5M8PQV6_9LECA|nr:MAG: hypothetical protein FRX48_04069 [Lasallia pustulata]
MAASRASETRPNKAAGEPPRVLRHRSSENLENGAQGLPAEKGFPIQVGSEMFKLSGASIMSDAPSYFSKFFEEQLRQNDYDSGAVRTLFIDRDPVTFRDIALHLQGYYVLPRDSIHFVKLFTDAQFYSLPRLIAQLSDTETFVRIGDRNFQIPRDIFSSPGDSPNFFSLGFAVFFTTPGEVFPGLDRQGLLRPPAVIPPSVPNRSAEVFDELLHVLQGYPIHIRNEEHRAELLRDCRYFHLRGLEQKLISHHISYNIPRGKSEIVIGLEDIRQSGISFVADASPSDRPPLSGWVNYARPFVDETAYELIVEVGSESTQIDLARMRADFHGVPKSKITSLFNVVANKMNLPTNLPLGLTLASGGAASLPVSLGNTPLSDAQVKICIEHDAHIVLDGDEYYPDPDTADHDAAPDLLDLPLTNARSSLGFGSDSGLTPTPHPGSACASQYSRSPGRPPPRKRKRRGSLLEFGEWVVTRGQWRLRVQPRGMGGGGSRWCSWR